MPFLHHLIGEANNENIVEILLYDGFEHFQSFLVANLFKICIEVIS